MRVAIPVGRQGRTHASRRSERGRMASVRHDDDWRTSDSYRRDGGEQWMGLGVSVRKLRCTPAREAEHPTRREQHALRETLSSALMKE